MVQSGALISRLDHHVDLAVAILPVGVIPRREKSVARGGRHRFDRGKTSPLAKVSVQQADLRTQYQALITVFIDNVDVVISLGAYEIAFLQAKVFRLREIGR